MEGPLKRLAARLEGVRRNGHGWVARCPAHDDREPSLSLSEGDDGRALLHCHAGCPTEHILAAVGLELRELFPAAEPLRHPRHGAPSQVWAIRDKEGRLFAHQVRFDIDHGQGQGKAVLWHRYGRWSLQGTPLAEAPLYGSERIESFDPATPVFLHEGEKAADAGRRGGLQSLGTVTGASGTPGPEALEVLRGFKVILWPDHDTPGREHMARVAKALVGVAREVRRLDPEALGVPEKGDAVEWLDGWDGNDGDAEGLRAELLRLAEPVGKKAALLAVEWRELLARDFPPLQEILSPWLREKTIAMVYGWRGTGKTWVSLGIATAVASGGSFLRWQSRAPRGVLLMDGEMPMQHLQTRTRQLIQGAGAEPEAALRFLPADLQERGFPNLAQRSGQLQVEEHLEGVDLVILDNLSTLFHGGAENEAESWSAAQEWMLSLRRSGLAVIYLHHAGKSGTQRGTSRREDVADVVVALKRPGNYRASDGARFEVHFEKARGLYGEGVASFEARLEAEPSGGVVWSFERLPPTTLERVVELYGEGKKQADIARELGVHRSNVCRAVQTAKGQGLLQ